MLRSRLRKFGQRLVALRLLDAAELERCLAQLEGRRRTADELVQVLQREGLLTAYQVSQLKKDKPESLVVGRYKLLYRNASGSFARVFRACSLDDRRTVALKLLRQRWSKDPQMVRLFRREAEIGRRLKHKNIVPIHEVGSDADRHYFTMEFVEGGNLQEFLKVRGRLDPAEATRYLIDVSEALDYARGMGVSHRDLRLSNVLMSARGVAKLTDFGLAGNESAASAARAETLQRTLEYATIERATGAAAGDPRTDLFFLGAIYYELLAGVPPYPRTKSREERAQIDRYRNVRPICAVASGVPPRIAGIVERLMQLEPNRRYQTPAEVLADLKPALAELAGPSGPAGRDARDRDSAGRSDQPAVLCIESRSRVQSALREHLSEAGFRVLMVSDLQRGLNRLERDPPDALVVVAKPFGERAVEIFERICRRADEKTPVKLLVLPEELADRRSELEESATGRVLLPPLSIQRLSRELRAAFNASQQRSRGPNPGHAGTAHPDAGA